MPTTTSTRPVTNQAKTSGRSPWWRIALEIVLFGTIAVILLEWFLGFSAVWANKFLQPDKVLGVRHIPGKLVTWRLEGYSHDCFAPSGLRDIEHPVAKPAGVTRVALLGDSSTEGMQVSLNDTYARVLEKELNSKSNRKFEVINFACSSYSNGQELVQLKTQIAPYQPDIVILLYNRGDSIENTRNPVKPGAEPRTYFYLDSGGKLQADNSVLESLPEPNPTLEMLRRNSHIYGVFSQANMALSIHEVLYRRLRSSFQSIVAAWTPHKSSAKLSFASYPTPDAMKVTEAVLAEINQECKRQGARFVVVLFPNILGDKDLMRQGSAIVKLSQRDHFDFVDLTGPFTVDPYNVFSLFLQFHFSSAGHKVVADQLCHYLLGTGTK